MLLAMINRDSVLETINGDADRIRVQTRPESRCMPDLYQVLEMGCCHPDRLNSGLRSVTVKSKIGRVDETKFMGGMSLLYISLREPWLFEETVSASMPA